MGSRFFLTVAGLFLFLFFSIIFVVVIMPNLAFAPAPSDTAVVYTPLEWEGREIYKREGCWYCHSQFVRLQDRGIGAVSQPGDYVNETPHLLGTARTGPDLSNEGNKFPDEWHRAHFADPRAVSPGSVMPSFTFLNDHYVKYRGEDGVTHQVTEMEALIAYVQSLGRMRTQERFVEPPWEYDFDNPDNTHFYEEPREGNPYAPSEGTIGSGRGIFLQNCAVCHGTQGLGNGPASVSMLKKPANFTRPFYAQYTDDFWFYRVSEGVPGTRMPRWESTLDEEQRWYVVNYLKTLPGAKETMVQEVESVEEVEQVRQAYEQMYQAIEQSGR